MTKLQMEEYDNGFENGERKGLAEGIEKGKLMILKEQKQQRLDAIAKCAEALSNIAQSAARIASAAENINRW